MTPGERRQIVEKIGGDWYYLDRHVKDDQERRQFVWDVAREGLVEDTYFCSTLGNYYEPRHTTIALDYIAKLQATPSSQEHRGVRGWDYSIEWLLQRISELDPAGLKAYQGLPGVASDFSQLFLAHNGAVDDISPSARRTLARAWASSVYDEQWYSVRESVPQDDWAQLVLESITSPEASRVEWDRIREYIGLASVEQRLTILRKDQSQHLHAHAMEALAELTADQLPLVEAQLDGSGPEDYQAPARRRALSCVLLVAHARHSRAPSQTVLRAFGEELAHYPGDDTRVTLAAARALASIDLEVAESTMLAALEARSYGPTRALAVMGAVPRLMVLEAGLTRIEELGQESDAAVVGLAEFGSLAVKALTERLALPKLAAPLAITYVRALDAIGDPAAAAALVEQTGASAKGVRVAASQALENLGPRALTAVSEGLKAKKKSIRETCESLVQVIELSASNPVKEHEKRLAKLDAPDLEVALAELVTASSISSDDAKKVTPFAERYGSLVLVRVRDFFLEKPDDWRRAQIWQGTVDCFAADPDVFWVVTDAFSRLPKGLYSYYVDDQARLLSRLAARAPEKIAEAIVHYLKGTPPEHRAKMLRVLIDHAPKTDVDVYLNAMQDSSKVVRELGVEGITHFGADAVEPVLGLLESKKKDVRLAAAMALTGIPAAGHVASLKGALASEKTADVRTFLEQAVEAAGGSAVEVPGADGAAADDEEIDAFLAGLNQAKLPSFIDVKGLPPLKFGKSGNPLSFDATLGLLTRLMKEDPDNQDVVARHARQWLEEVSANEFSIAIKDAWAKSGGKSKDKWAIYQQATPRQRRASR